MGATAIQRRVDGKPPQASRVGSNWRKLQDAWQASLPRRVAITASVLTILVALIGGILVMSQVRSGILAGKRQASIVEASTALQRMQNQLNDVDLRTQSVLDRMGQLAVDVAVSPSQYGVIVDTGSSRYASRGLLASSVPNSLTQAVQEGSSNLWITATTLQFQDGHSEPGIVIGSNLQAPNGMNFPIYFLFSMAGEQATLVLIQNALLTSGLVLIVALSLVTWLVSRQVTAPVQQASSVALRIANGDLGLRLPVRGSDEFATLARSMNQMASNSQRQIVQLEELSQMQQRFVSDVSHELRTPLTTMRMAADVLYDERAEFDATTARTAELLHDEIDRFEVLLADLLEISRFDAGAAELVIEDVDLVDLVAQEIAATDMLAKNWRTEIRFEHPPKVRVDADPRRIRRIVSNLLTNAIEHGESRPIDVMLASDDEAVALVVRDHGVGLQPGQEELVFHRFWRADASRSRQVGGGGLGLAISREDAHLHRGWLEASSDSGEGSTFRLTLPRSQSLPLTHSPLPLSPDELPAGE